MSSQIELIGQNSSSGGSSKVFVTTGGKLSVNDSQLSDVTTAGKLQCNVTSSALPTGAATETSLTALSTKLVACNTGAVVISSGNVIATLSATDNGVLDDISGKLPDTLDASGALKVTSGVISTTTGPEASGVQSITVDHLATKQCTAIDLSSSVCASIYGSLNDTTASIIIEVSNTSPASGDWYKTQEYVPITSGGHFYKNFNGIGAKYVRLSYTNNTGSQLTWTIISNVKK